jgi:hypothetical protein
LTIKGAIQAGQRRGRLVFSIKRRSWKHLSIEFRDDKAYPHEIEHGINRGIYNPDVLDLTATDWELVR